ncbi:MAG: 30S ribosomal protein S4e [Candidatus Nanoarchaeia archaeon]|nr:30S ribosomal protein S4e [Candidatus Nanoarchaeia archaeon]MDD5499788.1 30S ribosomal protein S4e [Candidatus Nanoarchaeia archaeon]
MHLKRLNTPKRWNLSKKKTKFVARPKPGAHPKAMSVPLIVILRDSLKLVNTKSEAKKMINEKKILVDLKPVKELNQGIGLFDILSIPSAKIYYRMVLDYKGGLKPIVIDEKESNLKLLKIYGKTRIKNGMLQFNFSGGKNLVLKEKYGVNDSVLFDLSKSKIIKAFPIKKGSKVLVIKGKHAGEIATLEGFKEFENITKDRAILNNKGASYQTMKDYVFVLGESKEEIKIRE